MFGTWKAALGLKGGFYVALVLALVVFILEAVLYSAGFILSGGRRKIMLWSNMGHVAKGIGAYNASHEGEEGQTDTAPHCILPV